MKFLIRFQIFLVYDLLEWNWYFLRYVPHEEYEAQFEKKNKKKIKKKSKKKTKKKNKKIKKKTKKKKTIKKRRRKSNIFGIKL